jgi:hypothetical protein
MKEKLDCIVRKQTKFLQYISDIAEDQGLTWHYRLMGGIIIKGREDQALELVNEGTNIALYYFSSFTNDAIWYCDEMDLSDPKSIDWVMEWMSKLK